MHGIGFFLYPMARKTKKTAHSKKRTTKSKKTWFQGVFGTHTATHVLFACVVLVGCVMVYRLYDIQVVHGTAHRERVAHQYQQVFDGSDIVRGDIYFRYRDGNRLLAATDQEYFQLVINMRNVANPLELQYVLKEHVDYDPQVLANILQKENDPYEILVPRLSDSEVEALRENHVRGIELHSKSERYYPLGDLGSEVLGFVSYRGDTLVGTYGLEKYYDHILRRDGATERTSLLFSLFDNDAQEASEDNQSVIAKHIAREGSLVTTIEPTVQEYLISQLQSIDQRFGSTYSAGLIMNARTGTIVAMGSSRGFDSNTERSHYRNVLVEDRYEFGSIMKPFTVAMALDTDTIDLRYTYNDTGSMTLNRYTIYNYDRQGRGPYTDLQTILTQSLNTGAAQIAMALGADDFVGYINRLGFSTETGIDLPYEVYGNTENIDTGRDVELATASYGQGVSVTAIEMLRAWAVLANDGVSVTPYMVDMIEYGDLIPARNIPVGGGVTVFDSSTIDEVTELLVNVVDDSSTFSPYALPNHSVAIKTGTAQLVDPRGGYYSDQFLHSIAGYFPAQAAHNEDKYVVLIFTHRPQGARYSSTTLKDAFFNTVGFMVNYYDLPPDRNISSLDNFN